MHLDHLPSLVISAAGWTVASFVVAVIIDNVLGVVDAIVGGTFSMSKLPSFLQSSFGTKQALALLGLIVAAYVSGGDVRSAALAALTAGGGALTLSVLADIYSKLKGLVAKPTPTPAATPSK